MSARKSLGLKIRRPDQHLSRAVGSHGLVDNPFENGQRGHLGGSVVERLPSAQGVILGSWDRVPQQAPHWDPASPSSCASASLCVSLMNK